MIIVPRARGRNRPVRLPGIWLKRPEFFWG